MKKTSVYIDTYVIGGCFDQEFSHYSNRLFEDFKNAKYIPVISEVVENEITFAPPEIIEEYKKLFDYDCQILKVEPEAIELARYYQRRKILTKKYFDDGMHIALTIK